MSIIDAVYEHGMFRPLKAVGLAENQRVRLHVGPINGTAAAQRLDNVRQLHQHILTSRGGQPLPDSVSDIAADRQKTKAN